MVFFGLFVNSVARLWFYQIKYS